MRLHCPLCGDRDIREYMPKGSARLLDRPAADAEPAVWNDYLHLRENPAGRSRELWCHSAGCGAWLVVERDTVSHAVLGARLAEEEAGA